METPTLVETFINHGRYLRGWSPSTVRTYRQVLSGFRVGQVSKQSLSEYILSLQARGLTPGGINIHIRTVNSFLTWLQEEGHTEERHRIRLLRPLRNLSPSLLTAMSNDS